MYYLIVALPTASYILLDDELINKLYRCNSTSRKSSARKAAGAGMERDNESGNGLATSGENFYWYYYY